MWWDKCYQRTLKVEEGSSRKESEATMQEWSERCNDAGLQGTRRGPWVKEGEWPLDQQPPSFLAPGTGFVKDKFSMDQGEWRDGFEIILMRSLQHRSFPCTVLSRVPTPIRIYCCHWSDRRWNSDANEGDGRACKYRGSSACPLATHLLLCGPVPHRPWTGTGL